MINAMNKNIEQSTYLLFILLLLLLFVFLEPKDLTSAV